MGYVIDLIVIGRHGDRLWQFHSGRSAHHALAVMEQFAGHLNLHLRDKPTPPEICNRLHSLFEGYGVSCPCLDLGEEDTLLMHLHRPMHICIHGSPYITQIYEPYMVVWSRHLNYNDKQPLCQLCHQSVSPVRHITRCCFQSYCRRCITEWGRFHTQCPHCAGGMHFYRIQ